MKILIIMLVVLLLVGLVLVSGCIGGGNNEGGFFYILYEEIFGGFFGLILEEIMGIFEFYLVIWQILWDVYYFISLNGGLYYIIEVEYIFIFKIFDGEKIFNIIKKCGYVKVYVYVEENGEKKDLGEFNLFVYYGKIIFVIGNGMFFEYIVMVRERSEDSDKYFLELVLNFGVFIMGSVVVVEVKFGNFYFYWSNLGVIGQYSEFLYIEGDLNEVFGDMGSYFYIFWFLMLSLGVWSGLEDCDLMKVEEYDYSFLFFVYYYRIDLDGMVIFDGNDFGVSNVEWSYFFGGVIF